MRCSDEEIMRRVQAGNAELFHLIFERHFSRIDSFVRRSLGDPESSEDVVADVFIRALQSAGRYEVDRGMPYLSYLYGIARHAVRDRLSQAVRERDRAAEPEEAPPDPARTPLQEMLRREADERLRSALTRLPPDHRQIIQLAYDEELSARDIAHIMDKPSVSAVTSHLHRALQALRRIVEAEGYFADLASEEVKPHVRKRLG